MPCSAIVAFAARQTAWTAENAANRILGRHRGIVKNTTNASDSAVQQTTVGVTDETATPTPTVGEAVKGMVQAISDLTPYQDNPPANVQTASKTDDKGITLLSCILSRPKNPNVFEKFGRKSTIAVDIHLPIIMANGVTIQVPAALWGRLTSGENGQKTVFDLSFAKGIGVDDDSKVLSNDIKRQVSEWEGWALASSEAHRRLTTPKAKSQAVELDYEPTVKPGLVGTGMNMPTRIVRNK